MPPRGPRRPPVFDLEFQHQDLDSKTVAALERLSQALRVLIWRAAKRERMSPLQVQFLVHILHNPSGERRVSRLAASFGVTKATASDALSTLEEKGLVARQRHEGDRRAVPLSLTAYGRRAARRLMGWADAAREALAGLPWEERAVVARFLMSWIESLQRAGVVTVARMCVTCRFFAPDAHPGARAPHHCRLLNRPLAGPDLRVDCPEHAPLVAVAP